jgi:hypothetical protein
LIAIDPNVALATNEGPAMSARKALFTEGKDAISCGRPGKAVKLFDVSVNASAANPRRMDEDDGDMTILAVREEGARIFRNLGDAPLCPVVVLGKAR